MSPRMTKEQRRRAVQERLAAEDRRRELEDECESLMKLLADKRHQLDRMDAGREPAPSLRLDFALVRHGYQCDVYADGRLIASECRDFGGSHHVGKLKAALVDQLLAAVKTWRADR